MHKIVFCILTVATFAFVFSSGYHFYNEGFSEDSVFLGGVGVVVYFINVLYRETVEDY